MKFGLQENEQAKLEPSLPLNMNSIYINLNRMKNSDNNKSFEIINKHIWKIEGLNYEWIDTIRLNNIMLVILLVVNNN